MWPYINVIRFQTLSELSRGKTGIFFIKMFVFSDWIDEFFYTVLIVCVDLKIIAAVVKMSLSSASEDIIEIIEDDVSDSKCLAPQTPRADQTCTFPSLWVSIPSFVLRVCTGPGTSASARENRGFGHERRMHV